MKVVVVGNSRDLLDRDDGETIDACDRIVRINSFRLHGHERQVGSRIDIVSLCLSPDLVRSALVHSAHLIAQARELWTPIWRGNISDADIATALSLFKRKPSDLIFCDDTGHKEVVTRLYDLVFATASRRPGPKTQTEDGLKFLPTTGFQTVHLARARFPAADLYITGFGLNAPFNLRRFDTSGISIWKGHDVPAERELLLKGIEDGLWNRV